MSTSELLVYLLACYGVTFTICSSKILSTPRSWLRRSRFLAELLSCYFCTGFWVSGSLSLLVVEPSARTALYAFAGATACYVTDAVVLALEIRHMAIGDDDGS